MLAVLRYAGPSTTRELLTHLQRYRPHVSHVALQHLLTHMRRHAAIQGLSVHGNHQVFWARPGQPLPVDAGQRVQAVTVSVGGDRRRPIPPAGQNGASWWVVSRDAWSGALSARWRQS